MTGIENLEKILASMEPVLNAGEFVFCTFSNMNLADLLHLNPVASIKEAEGLTLIIEKKTAEIHNLESDAVFSHISLSVHSSLEAVGLTAAFAQKLASKGISANVIAGYFHDHIFVQKEKALQALEALNELQLENSEE